MPQNLPNLLTGLRIVAIPLMVVCYYLPQPISTVGAAVVFIVAAVTDWFDGWVARRMGQTSQFGAFLDPVADKLLVTVALILLMHRMDNIFITLAGMVVIGREIVISALREWMAQLGKAGLGGGKRHCQGQDRRSDDGDSYPDLVSVLAGGGGDSAVGLVLAGLGRDPDAVVDGSLFPGVSEHPRGRSRISR